MKIHKYILCLLPLTLCITGCKYDDSEAWDAVNALDKRVTTIEETLRQINSDISNMQTICNAIEKNLFITSVNHSDNTYSIVFSDGKKIEINDGKDGKVPVIGANGHWWIGGSDTGIAAIGTDGKNGMTPSVGTNENWWIGGTDTGIPARCDDPSGYVPYVGENGNWWIANKDTGVKAVGRDGKDGQDGLVPYIGQNGNWWIGTTDTGVEATDSPDQYPAVTIVEQNNVFYWATIMNGVINLILNADGNPIPATGNTIVPTIKFDIHNYWLISFDGGITWEYVTGSNGELYQWTGGSNCNCAIAGAVISGNYFIITLTSGEIIRIPLSGNDDTGIPPEEKAKRCPWNVTEEETNITIPGFSTYTEPSNKKVMSFSFTGIRTNSGTFMKLYGTDTPNQNIWMEIDDTPVSFVIYSENEVAKAQADVVFLVDNSGSMNEEANYVAKEINDWAKELNKHMDVKFGVVGSEGKNVNGALDIADASVLSAYLNRSGVSGTSRTEGFSGSNQTTLKNAASQSKYLNSGYSESGGMLLRFADEQFSFRSGSNRTYVGFTDEPNQPEKNHSFSVESFNRQSSDYNWSAQRGTIHYVFSDNRTNYSWWDTVSSQKYVNENPRLFSNYTGGSYQICRSDFTDFDWEKVAVTGSIENSFVLGIRKTASITVGTHKVTITIYDGSGNKGKIIFRNVSFNN